MSLLEAAWLQVGGAKGWPSCRGETGHNRVFAASTAKWCYWHAVFMLHVPNMGLADDSHWHGGAGGCHEKGEKKQLAFRHRVSQHPHVGRCGGADAEGRSLSLSPGYSQGLNCLVVSHAGVPCACWCGMLLLCCKLIRQPTVCACWPAGAQIKGGTLPFVPGPPDPLPGCQALSSHPRAVVPGVRHCIQLSVLPVWLQEGKIWSLASPSSPHC